MEETTYYEKSGILVTDKQVRTKDDSVLVRDISAVQLKTPIGGVVFFLIFALFCGLVAFTTDSGGVRIGAWVLALILIGAAATGKKLVVITLGGKEVKIDTGLSSDMQKMKNAIARAMTQHPRT